MSAPTRLDPVNILLVDDQPAKLLTYESILGELGENLVKVSSATEALEYLLRNEVAVVLVDVVMPELDGYELAAMIRQHPRFQRTSIIFVSALLLTDLDRLRGYECGAVDYVPVPVVPEILRAKVSVFAELYRKTRALERLNAELEQRVAERTAALEATTAALQEADRRKDEFLAMLAHELRNPLAPIRTGLELIRVAGNSPSAVERVRSAMERQVAHMVRLIDDLLDVSRITSGKIQLQREPTLLSSLLSSAIDANAAAIADRKIQLTVDVPETPCVLDVDPTRMVQVISNLLHNATKFTSSGGSIVVAAQTAMAGENSPGELRLSVRDSGIGIASAFLPRVFDLFSQGDRAASDSGLGIGLALAHRIVDMHSGRIEVLSEGPGQGSEFIIRLPLSTQPPVDRSPEPPLGTKIDCRVIIIDDNRDAATVTAMLIEELGGQCRVAYDALSGLLAMREYRPDIVLLDVGMAGVDGYETCGHIRREFGDGVTVVALTGFGQEEDKARAARAGFSAHLTKPADPAILATVLLRCSTRDKLLL